MDLTLGQLISVRQTYEATLEQKLLEMDVWFQEQMWDGSGDENDPKYLTKEDFECIQALTSKIQHMCIQIGCPNSVNPMIESIINRKLKRWQGEPLFYGSMSEKGWEKGKQLRTKDCVNIVKKAGDNENRNDLRYNYILTGHFRWNNRGYILSRLCTELLSDYYYNNFFID